MHISGMDTWTKKHKNTKYTDAYFRDGHLDKDDGGNQGFDSFQEASKEEEGGGGTFANAIIAKLIIDKLFEIFRRRRRLQRRKGKICGEDSALS